MHCDAYLTLEGRDCLYWIKEDEETGLINIYFETEEGEVSLKLEPTCFKTLANVINEFSKNGKIANNPSASKGRMKPRVNVWMDNDDTSIKVDWELVEESSPDLVISSRSGKVNLGFNLAQAKEIEERCRKIQEIRQSIKDVQKKKIINAEGSPKRGL